MPNLKSPEKRMRSDAKKAAKNQAALSELKTLSQKLRASIGKPDEAKAIAQQAIARYDRAVSRGIIPRRRADRRKSRIARFLAKLEKK